MVPTKPEKYGLSQNNLTHLQMQQNALFVEETRMQVKEYISAKMNMGQSNQIQKQNGNQVEEQEPESPSSAHSIQQQEVVFKKAEEKEEEPEDSESDENVEMQDVTASKPKADEKAAEPEQQPVDEWADSDNEDEDKKDAEMMLPNIVSEEE